MKYSISFSAIKPQNQPVSKRTNQAMGARMVNAAAMKRAAKKPARSHARAIVTPEPFGSASLRAFRTLEVVVAASEACALDDVARATGLSKPTAFRILTQLESSGMLVREPGNRRYGVGHRLASLALAIMKNGGLRAERHAIIQRLVEKIGETCNVAILDGRQMMYLDRVETSWPLRLHLAPGSRVPLHCTSGGKLFLSQLPRARWEKLIGPGPYERHTSHTIVNGDDLDRELARIRAQGWSADREELLAGIICLAVPVTDRAGGVIASLALQAPLARMTHAQSLEHLPALRAAAAALAATFVRSAPAGANGRRPAKRRPTAGR
jgi:IclR family acetate operon transcriptional repressor